MANPHCACPLAGFCERHKMEKSEHLFSMCKGIAPTIDCGRKYWVAWERGLLGATAPAEPRDNPAPFCIHDRGMGDVVARGINRATFGLARACGSCKDRQALLNHWLPAEVPPIEPVTFTAPVRHLTFHLWPIAGNGIWKWHCDVLRANAELFNGKRIVAIATSNETVSADEVRAYLGDFTDEFVIVRNQPHLREVLTWVPMLEKLEAYQGDQDVTFSCQGKGVRRNGANVDDPQDMIFLWTKAMYETCLHWSLVQAGLERHGIVGSFRRTGRPQRAGWGPWHYSGTFFWWRNRDAFHRNWRYVPQRFYGTEAWPGLMFRHEESVCLLADNAGDLYRLDYWNEEIAPQLAAWRAANLKGETT